MPMPRLLGLAKTIFKPKKPKRFTAGNREAPGIPGGGEDIIQGKPLEKRPFATKDAINAARHGVWRSHRQDEWKELSDPSVMEVPHQTPFGGMSKKDRKLMGQTLEKSLDQNLKTIQWLFRAPRNNDLIVRRFTVRYRCGTKNAAVVYVPSLIKSEAIRDGILSPLMRPGVFKSCWKMNTKELADSGIPAGEVRHVYLVSNAVVCLAGGNAVVFVDGDRVGVTVDTKDVEHRPVQESSTEAVVRGPHQGFVENMRVNISLIKTYLVNPQLITEFYSVSARAHRHVSIMYLEGVANPKLVDEVRKRVTSIKTSEIMSSAQLTEYLRDNPVQLFPCNVVTERPDKVASMIQEGHIAIVDDSPAVLLLPSNIWSLMQSSEDYYVSPIAATAFRSIRWFALLTTLYVSALYIAVTTYHPEMLPTEFMFALAATREGVPFPASVAILVMEVAFELIREGGIRVPTVIGPTLGIVGAVILGQAAVEAGIVSPILVVVVAISALGSFAIPNYELSIWARITKFAVILSASFFGIPGITLITIVILTRLLSLCSLGMPITAPVLPHMPHSSDILAREPFNKMRKRPGHTKSLDPDRSLGTSYGSNNAKKGSGGA